MPAAVGVGRIRQNGRRLQCSKLLAPEAFGHADVLLRQPLDVIGITPTQLWQALTGVQAQHFAEQT